MTGCALSSPESKTRNETKDGVAKTFVTLHPSSRRFRIVRPTAKITFSKSDESSVTDGISPRKKTTMRENVPV